VITMYISFMYLNCLFFIVVFFYFEQFLAWKRGHSQITSRKRDNFSNPFATNSKKKKILVFGHKFVNFTPLKWRNLQTNLKMIRHIFALKSKIFYVSIHQLLIRSVHVEMLMIQWQNWQPAYCHQYNWNGHPKYQAIKKYCATKPLQLTSKHQINFP